MSEITDSTIARVAGNLLSGNKTDWQTEVSRQRVVDAAVETAELVAQTVVRRRKARDKDAASKPISERASRAGNGS